ncbi:ABC transporter ATP-binding protein [Tistrella mobilis]|uniref:Nitrate ABC transporter ATP-binding protein n=1 Tax=Tistrella mobilis TaxID=171437 RepID=A0A162K9D1_9PROT|nr:ABC transporter ATP-binding protein [Tistrella mobilis]KYO50743.1 nitrate ABC transporter ATP-binding protein [Tistrella mobilis]
MRLILKAVSHAYDGLHALGPVDLTVGAGRIVAVVGPSGCGKSTLLGIAGGLIRPTSGEVLSAGAAPEGCLNPLTYVFQDFALLPWRTVAQNVALPLEGRGLGAAEVRARVADALARTGLADFAGAVPRQLSGGMRQRVGIARALAVSPAVLLMDEPLSALDAQTRELLIEDLVALHGRAPFSALYVTHNLTEAVRLAHEVVVLSRRPGRIREVVQIDTPLDDRAADGAGMAALADRLWRSIRDEAATADREVQHG